jgi:hypothetical protein
VSIARHCELKCQNSIGNHRRAPHALIDLLILLLAIELCEGREHASNLLVVSVSISISISRTMRKRGAC